MSKKIEKTGVIFVAYFIMAAATLLASSQAIAVEPQTGRQYYVQVPHVVLPETIQYKHFADNRGYEVSAGASQRPATYTPFPSYLIPNGTEFRTINNLYYPISPVAPASLMPETVAQVCADNQIIPTERQITRNGNPETSQQQVLDANSGDFADLMSVPKFELPSLENMPQQEVAPVYLTKLNESNNPIRQVSDTAFSEIASEPDDECDTPSNSIVFLKSRQVIPFDNEFYDEFEPLRLGQAVNRHSAWLERESLFVRPVTFTEVAPPAQLGFMQPGAGFQQAQAAPAYGQQPYQQNAYGTAAAPHPNYAAATGLNSVWNSWFGAAAPQQTPAQTQRYQSLTQLGGMMPVMSGQPMPTSGYGMPMQQPMQPAMPQQTIGYILLYPQAAQSGVNMQLAGQGNDAANDATSTEDNAAAESNTPNWNAMQMQATFIPAQQMSNVPSQFPMPQMPPANPMMMGGMNPYMMNPMMMGGMNPYMMNPMMMGMGGMMPPIIIQMPADSGRRMGFFARRRAAREESQNRYQQASQSLSSLFAQPSQMPAQAAYPYGYFGVTASPSQAGGFGGYHNMSTQTVQYPGM